MSKIGAGNGSEEERKERLLERVCGGSEKERKDKGGAIVKCRRWTSAVIGLDNSVKNCYRSSRGPIVSAS